MEKISSRKVVFEGELSSSAFNKTWERGNENECISVREEPTDVCVFAVDGGAIEY